MATKDDDKQAERELRDVFAAAALMGLCAQSDSPFHQNVARQAYALADLMLQERAK